MRLVLDARAKINLYLEVVGKRSDGYHELVTVMQSISLADRITLKRRQTGGVLLTVDGNLPTDEGNLVVRAANAYFAASGNPFGVDIHLEKRIPMAAGLGGGSADAAAALKGLNAIDGMRFDENKLVEIAADIGADVPFCLAGGTKLCRGIGEKMTDLAMGGVLSLVVAKAGEGVSTPDAFRELDLRYDDFRDFSRDHTPTELLAALADGDISRTVLGLFNRFESVVEPMRPAVTRLKQQMLSLGALAAQMSGSGPAVFGIFADAAAADRAAVALTEMGVSAFACQTVQDI